VTTAAATLALARERLEPVELILGSASAGDVAANRNDPMGPYDDRLTVLAARRPDGSIQAVLVHFACHPTILGAENRLVSADFPGVLRRELAAAFAGYGEAPVVLYVNGAAGDVSTRFTRRGQDAAEVERIAKHLAMAAGNALATAKPLQDPLRHGSASVRLSPRRSGAPGADTPVSESSVIEPGAIDLSPAAQRIAVTRAQGEAMQAALTALPLEAIPSTLRIDAWTLGELALVAIPAELFVSLGREIERASPGKTLILGYANGYSGYLADRAAHRAGTYEALASPFGPEAGERVVATAARLVSRLRSGPGGSEAGARNGIVDRS
jgi:neutral ceramidase